MSESIQLPEILFKLIIRFSNGEMIQYVVSDTIDARMISSDTRYGVVTSYSCENPSECTDTAVINLRDVTFIKTERVTLEELRHERRMAGIRSGGSQTGEERLPKTLSQIKFI